MFLEHSVEWFYPVKSHPSKQLCRSYMRATEQELIFRAYMHGRAWR